MRTLNSYLSEYSASHRNRANIVIHKFCVPAIVWSTIGFLHTFEVAGVPLSIPACALAMIFYVMLRSLWVILSMTATMTVLFLSFPHVPELRWVSVAVFAIAWVAQFYGHHLEGKRPSFLTDLLFLLVGPLWVAAWALRKKVDG